MDYNSIPWDSETRGIAFYMGSLPVSWYGILVTIGVIVALGCMYFEWRKVGGTTTTFIWLMIVGLIAMLIGARWIYLLFNPEDITDILSFFSFGSGRSILGAVIGWVIGVKLYLYFIKIPVDFRMVFSIGLSHFLIAQAIGRWGNFANGEIYGQAVSEEQLNWLTPWLRDGMYIEDSSGMVAYRQPLFLIEFIVNLIGWFLIGIASKQIVWLRPGTHGSMYLIWYGITRASMELFRDEEYIMQIGEFPTSFLLAILFIIFGILSFIYFQWFYWNYHWHKSSRKMHISWKRKTIFIARWNLLLRRINRNQYKAQKIMTIRLTKEKINKARINNYQFYKDKIANDKYTLKFEEEN